MKNSKNQQFMHHFKHLGVVIDRKTDNPSAKTIFTDHIYPKIYKKSKAQTL